MSNRDSGVVTERGFQPFFKETMMLGERIGADARSIIS